MTPKQYFTNERLKKLFPNNFELANYAIGLARYFVKSGHEMSLSGILDEVQRHPNQGYLKDLESLPDEEPEEKEEPIQHG